MEFSHGYYKGPNFYRGYQFFFPNRNRKTFYYFEGSPIGRVQSGPKGVSFTG